MPADHLSESCRKLLKMGDQARIEAINSDKLWIEYPQAKKIIGSIRNILEISSRIQAPCLLVYGEAGSGKSSIIRQLKNNRETRSSLIFIALNQNPQNLNIRELIVDALGLPQGIGRQRTPSKHLISQEISEVIKLRGIKGIVIDEFNDALLVPKNEQLKNLSLLKGLSGDPYQLSIFGFGTPMSRNAISYDPQLSRRFLKSELKDWMETEDFRSFLAGIEENLPLEKPSAIYNKEIVSYLLSHTQGRMATIIEVIKSAASYAIKTKQERITIELLDRARIDPMGY